MKEKNQSAVLLGKLSAKSRFKGMTKAERRAKMKLLWEKSARKRSLDKKKKSVL